MTETGHQPHTQRSDWWSRRPRRSRTDSKVAGVAGGLGRYLGVDPILFRVGFVALTILGGAGVLAYCLLWLLLPADGDEVSAGESLIGRGRSSVSPVLAVGLAIAIIISITSSFSWGLPFWPALVIAFIAFHIARKQRRGPFRPGSDWEHRFRNTQQSFNRVNWSGGEPWYGQQSDTQQSQQQWGGQASGGQAFGGPAFGGPDSGQQQQQRGGQGWGHGPWGSWGSCGSRNRNTAPTDAQSGAPTGQAAPTAGSAPEDGPSPFDTPAFWDGEATPPSGGSGSDAPTSAFPADPFRKAPPAGEATGSAAPFATASSGGSTSGDPFAKSVPVDPFNGRGSTDTDGRGTADSMTAAPEVRTTPPAWDPLGAAPFAWDLPDIELAPQSGSTLVQRRTPSPVIARATVGTAFIVVAVQIFGIIVGWWTMGWAAVSGTALAVVAVGLLLQALRGRRLSMFGPGVALSFATVALAFLGISGVATVGDRSWAPTDVAAVQPEYNLTAGDAVLDLSGLVVIPTDNVTTAVTVNAGQVRVVLPANVNVNLQCSGNAGQLDCLGQKDEGLNTNVGHASKADPKLGTVNLDVHVGAGDVEVTQVPAR